MDQPVPHGQIIRLKKGAEEPYIILHKNAFPAVLDRIACSNILNYSIFLDDGLLFGLYLYHGNSYQADMDALAADHFTQEWWKLTAPMQVPFSFRKPGDWWAELGQSPHRAAGF